MPTTAEDEKVIYAAMDALISATSRCSKADLHLLWRRNVIPPEIFQWILKYRKERAK